MKEGSEKPGRTTRRQFFKVALGAALASGFPEKTEVDKFTTVEEPTRIRESARVDEPMESGPFDLLLGPVPEEDVVGKGFEKLWPHLLDKISKDVQTLKECEARGTRSEAAEKLNAIVRNAQNYEGLGKINQLNKAINLTIAEQGSVESVTKTIKEDWASPLEAIALSMRGEAKFDCKACALVKYAALERLGVTPKDRVLVITKGPVAERDATTGEVTGGFVDGWHVVALVRVDGAWEVLENMIAAKSVIPDNEYFTFPNKHGNRGHDWHPLYAFTENGVRAFTRTPLVSK